MNFFYVHNIFNIWFTTGALGLFFYLLPRLTGNPLFSHRLALWGFSSVWTGQHHLLYGPGPEWLELLSVSFSILAGIGNAAFLVNFVKTMEGAWHKMATDVAFAFRGYRLHFLLSHLCPRDLPSRFAALMPTSISLIGSLATLTWRCLERTLFSALR